MYLFFLFFFIFISVSLIVLILLQPAQGFNNTNYSNIQNNITSLGYIKKNNLMIKIIKIFSVLFLISSIILCNINNRKIYSDFFLEDSNQKNMIQEHSIDKKILNSDIPH